MDDKLESSVGRRLYYSLGSMLILIVILIAAIILFVSFGDGATWQRGLTGLIIALASFVMIWRSMSVEDPVVATWLGALAGMASWMWIGEISHQFGFVEIEDYAGFALLAFATVLLGMLWAKRVLPWGFSVFAVSFLLNWWGHALLLPQLHLAKILDAPIFYTTYKLVGILCLVAFGGLITYIIRKPASRANLTYYGLWLYALLVTGIEGITNITNKTFGH